MEESFKNKILSLPNLCENDRLFIALTFPSRSYGQHAIARRMNVSHYTIFYIQRSLKNKGLMTIAYDNRSKMFTATATSKLNELIYGGSMVDFLLQEDTTTAPVELIKPRNQYLDLLTREPEYKTKPDANRYLALLQGE